MTRPKSAQLGEVLDRLEARYGKLVTSEDPVEAGLLALLALHAPRLSTPESRDRLREAFIDWNEARVADPWDFTVALEAGGDPEARAFARAASAFLESLHAVLTRTSFDAVRGEPIAELVVLVERIRGAPPPVRAVTLAVLDREGGWHVPGDTAKVLAKLGVIAKGTSGTKLAKELSEVAAPEDRVRAHYLLTRYVSRVAGEDDPLNLGGAARRRGAKDPHGEKAPARKAAKSK